MQSILSCLTNKRMYFFGICKFHMTKNENCSLHLKNSYIILFLYTSLKICDKNHSTLIKILTTTGQFYNKQVTVFHKENKPETKSCSELILNSILINMYFKKVN